MMVVVITPPMLCHPTSPALDLLGRPVVHLRA
jgi:hypothetical protein